MAGSRTLKLSILADVADLKKNLDTGSKEVEGFGGGAVAAGVVGNGNGDRGFVRAGLFDGLAEFDKRLAGEGGDGDIADL